LGFLFRHQLPKKRILSLEFNIYFREKFVFEIEKTDNILVLKIPSSMSEVGGAINTIESFFKQYDVSKNLANQNCVVFRELVTNAIKHGHNHNSQLKVHVQIEHLKDKQFKIMVKDEGNGFDHSRLDFSIPKNAREIRNRGFVLVHALIEHFQINEKGNCITVFTLPF